jgi:DNA-binding CsgD family transcriptional regulator
MKIQELAEKLEKVNTTQQAETLLQGYLLQFKFRSYAFTYYSGHVKSGQKLKYHFVSSALRPWHLHYLEQAYADVDRTLEVNQMSTLPLFWDVHEQIKNAKNKREHRIRAESIEFGIHQGLSLPVFGPNKDFAALALHQFAGEHCLEDYKQHQFEWLSAAHLFYHAIKTILDRNNITNKQQLLTQREQQCLTLTAKSWRVEQIAKELKISVRTVNFHIQNANKKLGTNNKYQAMLKYFKLLDQE